MGVVSEDREEGEEDWLEGSGAADVLNVSW